MKQVILDTSFILTCVRQKIDFFENLMGMQIIVPKQVILELKGLAKSRPGAEIALKLLKTEKFKKIDLGKGHVDKLLIRFAKKDKDLIIATLDKEIKDSLTNHKLIIRGKNKLEIV